MTESARIIVHAAEPAPLAEQLAAAHPDVEVETCDSYAALPDLIARFRPDSVFSIRFAGTPDFPTAALMGKTGPAWIHVGGSGTDHLGKWDPAGKTVTNSAGVAAPVMAEYAIGALLHFTLDVPGLLQDKAGRHWATRSVTPLRGKTMLIIGLGHTGKAMARLAKAVGMTVLGTRASPRATPDVDEVLASKELPTLYPRADCIVVCAPLLASTRGLLDADAFSRMKPGALLVDLSRGGIVQEGALVEALRAGQIAGAALDVFETEPLPPDNALWEMENVLISPHCSSVFDGWEPASMELYCDNLTRWKAGQPLANIVDPKRGY